MPKQSLPSVEKYEVAKEKPKQAEDEMPIEGYLPRRVDVKLTRAQATILRDKLRELEDTGAKTADGRLVASRRQAVQWIIENQVQP